MASDAREAVRYHAFDGLRALMMSLGVVIHTVTTYAVTDLGNAWVFKDSQTNLGFDVLLTAIHTFRMPVFFTMAGFFTALLVERRGEMAMLHNRATRVLLPFALGYLLLIPANRFGFYYAQEAATDTAGPVQIALARVSANPLGNTTGHLWFLYYLVIYYAVVVGVRRFTPPAVAARCKQRFAQLMKKRWRLLPFAAAVGTLCLTMPYGALETSTSFLPSLSILAAYILFFGYGWFLWGWREDLAQLKGRIGAKGALAFVLFLVNLALMLQSVKGGPKAFSHWTVGVAYSGALLTWVLNDFWIGLFLRYLDRPSRWFRYFTDASYWIYLIHLPIVIVMAGLVTNMPWSAGLKALVVFTSTFTLCLLTYALFVRGSAIGVLLNGRRYAPLPEVTVPVAERGTT